MSTSCLNDQWSLLLLSLVSWNFLNVETRTILAIVVFLWLHYFTYIGNHVRKLSIELQFFSVLLQSSVQFISPFLVICEFILFSSYLGFHFFDSSSNLLVSHAVKLSHGL
jgi:hypothetical protein